MLSQWPDIYHADSDHHDNPNDDPLFIDDDDDDNHDNDIDLSFIGNDQQSDDWCDNHDEHQTSPW